MDIISYSKAADAEVLAGRKSQTYNQESKPTEAQVGDEWYVPSVNVTYKLINDGTSDVWVDISTSGSADALRQSDLKTLNGESLVGVGDITINTTSIEKPSITSPTNGAVDTDIALDVAGSAYTTSNTFAGTHTSSILEVATDTGFTNIVSIVTTGLETLTATGLSANTAYYARIKYISGDFSSEWSDTISFTTTAAGITAPTITAPMDGATDIGKNVAITTSTYSVFGHAEPHVSTTFQVASDVGFTNIITETVDDTVNLTSWTSGDLAVSTTYYIRAKHKSTSYDSGWSTAVSITTASSFVTIYGLDWDQTADTYTRTGDAALWTAGADFSNNLTVQATMRRCVLNPNGTVNYYLHPNDSTLKEDGVTPAVLDGTDGNVMVEVQKFYYKHEYDTTGNTIHRHTISLEPVVGGEVHPAFVKGGVEVDYRYFPAYEGYDNGGTLISRSGVYPTTNQTIGTFRTKAEANGAGWHQLDFLLYEAITLLCIVEYGTMGIQTALGQGRTALTGGTWVGGSYISMTGLSNGDGNFSNNVTYTGDADDAAADGSYMTYRGCENLYGNIWWFVDGILATNGVVHVGQDPTTFSSTAIPGDYVDTGVTTTLSDGFARELGNSKYGFLPTSVSGGSSSAGTTDYFYANDAGELGIARVGGSAAAALIAGPLFLALNRVAANLDVNLGAGVSR